ncbi:hypothetical protein [Chryseobacterium sp.]|uniref:hypothetical protein n=1 Tax=Chryseobacterium sp. TaxID=1871047 RepID=UPI0028982198|nr:hypothetical protein [Chryseobacterium sp.]
MKSIHYIFILPCLLYSCKQKDTTHIDKTNDSLKLSGGEKTVSDSFKTESLPYGNVMLIEKFSKIGSDFEVSETENKLLENEDSNFLSYYEKIFKNAEKSTGLSYKFSQKDIIDFGLNFLSPVDSISTYKGNYALSRRLPNIEKNKVLVFNSIENKGDNISKVIDLVVVNEKNKIVDNINLSRKLLITDEKYENLYGDYFKYFYIDKDYVVHIKYFTGWGDTVTRVFAYVKYKIQKNGNIVRYFDQENGFYKSEVEEGMVKNHLKEGSWKEVSTNFDERFYINEYKEGKPKGNIKLYVKFVDSESVYTIDRQSYKIVDEDFKMR